MTGTWILDSGLDSELGLSIWLWIWTLDLDFGFGPLTWTLDLDYWLRHCTGTLVVDYMLRLGPCTLAPDLNFDYLYLKHFKLWQRISSVSPLAGYNLITTITVKWLQLHWIHCPSQRLVQVFHYTYSFFTVMCNFFVLHYLVNSIMIP